MGVNPIRMQIGAYGTDGAGFNNLSAGNKVYNSGTPAPTRGPVDAGGYALRDNRASLRRQAIMNRAGQGGMPNG